MSGKNDYKWMVRVSCMTFNHTEYIVDTMNGFAMQQTVFPYVCTIIDDASTDGEQEVINNYLKEHFDLDDKNIVRHEETDDYVLIFARHKTNLNCYFAVFFLKYNHYSIKKPKLPYIAERYDNAKYMALCEGDDYWISPCMLQQKVNIMERDDHVSMICNNAYLFSNRQQKIIGCKPHVDQNSFISTKKLILEGGGYIATCSFLCRTSVCDAYPDYCRKCHVGDYPLQIMCAMKGKVFCLSEPMSVYRVDNPSSWVGHFINDRNLSEKRLNGMNSELYMLSGFANDYPAFLKWFEKRKRIFVILNVPSKKIAFESYKLYNDEFLEIIKQFNLFEKIRYAIYASPYKRKLKEIESIIKAIGKRLSNYFYFF